MVPPVSIKAAAVLLEWFMHHAVQQCKQNSSPSKARENCNIVSQGHLVASVSWSEYLSIGKYPLQLLTVVDFCTPKVESNRSACPRGKDQHLSFEQQGTDKVQRCRAFHVDICWNA